MRAWVLPASVVLHLGGVWALWPEAGGDTPRREAPPIEVDLIQQPSAAPGTQAGQRTSVAAPAREAPPNQGETPASVPASPTNPAPTGTPAVNLGDSDQWLDGLLVTGQNVVPPKPNAAYRNRPPRYPAEAARRGAEGTVSLTIHVSARGVPDSVLVGVSSGDASLDRAAREAVRLWRFTPAMEGDTPVPFDYAMDIRFVIGDAR